MLSDDRENLFLWSSYATLLASQRGKIAEARQVYVTCLSADRQVDDPYAVELFANWAEMEWLHGENARSLAITVVASGASNGGHVDLGKRHIHPGLDATVSRSPIVSPSDPFLSDVAPAISPPALLRARRVRFIQRHYGEREALILSPGIVGSRVFRESPTIAA